MERYPGDLICPGCKNELGVEYEDLSGSNDGTEPYNCPYCGRGIVLTTLFYFEAELANPDEEEDYDGSN